MVTVVGQFARSARLPLQAKGECPLDAIGVVGGIPLRAILLATTVATIIQWLWGMH